MFMRRFLCLSYSDIIYPPPGAHPNKKERKESNMLKILFKHVPKKIWKLNKNIQDTYFPSRYFC